MGVHRRIGLDSIVAQANGMAMADMDGEKVMMNIDKGKYFALNGVGSRIWELIANPRSVTSLISALKEEYDIDSATCQDNVLVFLNKLREGELVCTYE